MEAKHKDLESALTLKSVSAMTSLMSWASHFTCPSLSVLICKIGIQW
jgi:hypothetical protein